MRTHILDAAIAFSEQPFLKPLQISSGLITQITQADVYVTVRIGDQTATGRGSIYLSDLWAWPEPALSHETRDAALREYSRGLCADLKELCGAPSHPLEMGLRLHEALHHRAGEYSHGGENYDIPLLARAMCASPFDAALHDAAGHALNCSAFDFYEADFSVPSADRFFQNGAIHAIRRALETPRRALPAWLLVGASDDLERDVAPWIRERDYACFKLKILARDNAADVARVAEVFRFAHAASTRAPRLCVDSNEAHPDADAVLDFLQRLQRADADAFAALEYLEQPTGRDITRHAFDWRDVAALKPVLLDEGLTSLELLPLAAQQGWSGLALKTCKGHSFALTAAAWARERGLSLTMQDLTNPGLAAIHSALLAARLGTLNGVELNAPQYTPAANARWLPRLAELLEPHDGLHRLPQGAPLGLGSSL